MKRDEKWIDTLRKNLNDYEVKPSADLWEKIERDLPVSSRRQVRLVPLWLKMAAAAAVVAGVGGGGWMYLSRPVKIAEKEFIAGNFSKKKDLVKVEGETVRKNTGMIRSYNGHSFSMSVHQSVLTRNDESSISDEVSVVTDSVKNKTDDVNSILAAVSTAPESNRQGMVDKKEDEKQDEDVRSQSNGTPRNWYDAVPREERESMRQLAPDEGKQRWSIALTAMNGLPSVGGNTGSPAVMLSAMSDAPSSIRPFGNSLAEEYVNNQSVTLLGQGRKQESATSVKHKVPVSYGASFRYNITDKWGVESGLSYTLLNSTFSNEEDHSSYDQDLHYLELPIRVSYIFVNQRWFAVYAATGGAIAKCVSADIKGDNHDDYIIDKKPWQFSISTSAGVQLNLSGHFGIYVEPGVGYYFNDNSDLRTVYKDHPWSFKLNMGFRVSY